MAGGSLSPQGAGRYLAGSGGESLPSAPAVMALLASTVTSATVLAGEPPQPMASASMARRRGAPRVSWPASHRGGAGRHRSRSSSPGYCGSWARWSGSSGSECRWDWRGRPSGMGGRRPARTGWQSRERSGSSPVGAKGGRGPSRPLRAPSRRVAEAPVMACRWPRVGPGAGKWVPPAGWQTAPW
jgi:hypothetical protein